MFLFSQGIFFVFSKTSALTAPLLPQFKERNFIILRQGNNSLRVVGYQKIIYPLLRVLAWEISLLVDMYDSIGLFVGVKQGNKGDQRNIKL